MPRCGPLSLCPLSAMHRIFFFQQIRDTGGLTHLQMRKSSGWFTVCFAIRGELSLAIATMLAVNPPSETPSWMHTQQTILDPVGAGVEIFFLFLTLLRLGWDCDGIRRRIAKRKCNGQGAKDNLVYIDYIISERFWILNINCAGVLRSLSFLLPSDSLHLILFPRIFFSFLGGIEKSQQASMDNYRDYSR